LAKLRGLLAKVSRTEPSATYWPEILAAQAVADRAKCQAAVVPVLEDLKARINAADPLSARVAHLAGRITGRGRQGIPAAWAAVTRATAASRGAGLPAPAWTSGGGEIHCSGGPGVAGLYLRIPLRGDFALSGEAAGGKNKIMRIAYGGITWEIDPSGRAYSVTRPGQAAVTTGLQPALKLGEWNPFRLSVQGGAMTLEVAGRRFTAQALPADPDPWLILRRSGESAVRNLELTGSPAVPDRLALSGANDLAGWQTYHDGSAAVGPQAPWEAKGEEIVGRRLEEADEAKVESLLQYHRPLLEDGAIDYEFFHEPGKAEVHSALDRLAFLLGPDGVRVHWITDGPHERTGLAPDNATVEAASRRGPARLPLKAGEWNRMELALAGDAVTLRLNGVVVYERAIEPSNQRVFGLFHYRDETGARVRKVSYRGGWAKAVPAEKGWLTRGGKPVE
jgi:hypothetical protein